MWQRVRARYPQKDNRAEQVPPQDALCLEFVVSHVIPLA